MEKGQSRYWHKQVSEGKAVEASLVFDEDGNITGNVKEVDENGRQELFSFTMQVESEFDEQRLREVIETFYQYTELLDEVIQ